MGFLSTDTSAVRRGNLHTGGRAVLGCTEAIPGQVTARSETNALGVERTPSPPPLPHMLSRTAESGGCDRKCPFPTVEAAQTAGRGGQER